MLGLEIPNGNMLFRKGLVCNSSWRDQKFTQPKKHAKYPSENVILNLINFLLLHFECVIILIITEDVCSVFNDGLLFSGKTKHDLRQKLIAN